MGLNQNQHNDIW